MTVGPSMTVKTLLPCRSLSEPCRTVGAVGLSDGQTVGVCERRFPHSEPFAALCRLSDIDVLGLELHLSRSSRCCTQAHSQPSFLQEEDQAAARAQRMTSALRCMNSTKLHLHHLLLAMDPSPSRGSADKHTASHHHCKKHRRQQPVRSARPWAMTHRPQTCIGCHLLLAMLSSPSRGAAHKYTASHHHH